MVPTVRVIAMVVLVALVAGPLYAGGAVMVNREPATIDRNQVQWGYEARAPLRRSHVFGILSNPVIISPVLTADFKSNEELNWIISSTPRRPTRSGLVRISCFSRRS